jgi:FtsH-binding integral membrane protein
LAVPEPLTFEQRAALEGTSSLLGPVMFLVAVTVAFAAGGAYVGRDIAHGTSFLAWIGAIGCLIGLNVVVRRSQQLAMGLLFGVGFLLGIAIAPTVAYYTTVAPNAVWQAAGATALTVGALGSYGYATKRDLSSWGRVLFFALLGLILLGVVAIFVRIPAANWVYTIGGIVIFGGYTIFDFNRLRRTDIEGAAIPIAAGIFLDILNLFLLFLRIFGGRN